MKRQVSTYTPTSQVSRELSTTQYDNVKVVADNIDNIEEVANALAGDEIQTVAGLETEIEALGPIATEIAEVAANETNVSIVGNDLQGLEADGVTPKDNADAGNSAIDAVAENMVSINTVASTDNLAAIVEVANDLAENDLYSEIQVAAYDLQSLDANGVAKGYSGIDEVGSDLQPGGNNYIQQVAQDIKVGGNNYTNAVASNITDVNTVGANIDGTVSNYVTTLGTDLAKTDIDTFPGEFIDPSLIKSAENYATYAQTQATAAAASEALAEDWASKWDTDIATTQPVSGSDYSAKYYAEVAAQSEANASSDANYIRAAREASDEPTGYNHDLPDTMGILKLAVQELPATTFTVYGIDQYGQKITTASGQTHWGDSANTVIDTNEPHQVAHHPVDANTDIEWWIDGTKYTTDTLETVRPTTLTFVDDANGNPSVDTVTNLVAPASGLHFIFRDTTGLRWHDSFTTDYFEEFAFTTVIYGNSTSNEKVVFANERHGISMSGAVHKYLHLSEGARYVSGFDIVGLTVGAGTYTQIDAGRFFDEDIDRQPPIQTDSPFWFVDADAWRGIEDGLLLGYVPNGFTNIAWNEYTGTTWQLTEVGASDFTLMHFFATNDVEYPIVKILGQSVHNTANDAKDVALDEIKSLYLTGLPAPEALPLYTVILNAEGELVATDTGDTRVDWRGQDINVAQTSGDLLPSQGPANANKFLQTNGSIVSWTDIDAYLGSVYESL